MDPPPSTCDYKGFQILYQGPHIPVIPVLQGGGFLLKYGFPSLGGRNIVEPKILQSERGSPNSIDPSSHRKIFDILIEPPGGVDF